MITKIYYGVHYLGCPTVVRADFGTENAAVAATQIAFRFYHTDEMAREKSFIYGPSKSNIVMYNKLWYSY